MFTLKQFQFLIGSLKISFISSLNGNRAAFQFLIGSLKILKFANRCIVFKVSIPDR